jgi:hypothetical protein
MLTKDELLEAFAQRDFATVYAETSKWGVTTLVHMFDVLTGPYAGHYQRYVIQHYGINWHIELKDGKMLCNTRS